MIKRRFFSVLAIGLLMFFALASYALPGMQQIALWVAVPASAVLSFWAIPDRRMKPYLGIVFALYLWVAFTALFAVYPHLAALQLKRILGCFLMIFSINQLSKDRDLVPWLYLVFVVFYLGIVYYANANIYSQGFDYTEDRLDDDKLNANMIAYITFFVTFVIYILAEMPIKKVLVKVLKWLFVFSPVWSFIIAILTSSRQVIVIQVPLITVLLYVRYIKGEGRLKSLSFIIACIIVGGFLLTKGLSIYDNSLLSTRNEIEIGDDARSSLIKNALKVGITHPLVGVGPDCFGMFYYHHYTFSHCNYTELFANSGILGLALVVALMWKFISRQWKRYRKTRDKMFLAFWFFGVMYAVDNVFYVFYTNPWLMSFFFLVAMHAENYYNDNYCIGEKSI